MYYSKKVSIIFSVDKLIKQAVHSYTSKPANSRRNFFLNYSHHLT